MAQQESPVDLFGQIAQELIAVHSAEKGKMFGMEIIKIDGKAFAGFYKDCMTFKLTGEPHAAALQLEGSKLFDPSDMQRPMKEWVQVTFAHAKQWHQFAEAALEYVKAGARKKAK
jgi:hypothetical protein